MSRGATARLFVAVDPPSQVCEQLAEWARGVAAGWTSGTAGSPHGAARLLEAQSLHLTLCFLGSRPVAEIEALASALRFHAEDLCELSVGAPLWLPPRRPRALAVEIHDRAGELARLQEHLTDALSEVSGWEPQRRRFRPHITLARVRRGAAGARWPTQRTPSPSDRVGPCAPDRPSFDRSGREQPLPATPRLRFTSEAIVLYRSRLTPEGATYQALAARGLAAAER